MEELGFLRFYIPSIPFVAIHSAIFAYLGITLPIILGLNHPTSKHLNNVTKLRTGDTFMIITLLFVIFGTKAVCFFQGIIRIIKRYKWKKRTIEEECESKCSDDAKTCVSLNLTLESCSHIRQLANLPTPSELEISLDSIVINKPKGPDDAQSCMPGNVLENKLALKI